MKNCLLLFCLFLSTTIAFARQQAITITIPETYMDILKDINLTDQIPVSVGKNHTFELVIYYYSVGKEVMQYSSSGEINYGKSNGTIKALLKHRKDNKLIDVFFFIAHGDSKKSVTKNLTAQIKLYFTKAWGS